MSDQSSARPRTRRGSVVFQSGRQAGRGDLIESQDAQIAAQNAVTAAVVAYQEARLQLMLDIGALNTSRPQFWLKDHLAGFLPGTTPLAVGPETDKPVIPPDLLFNN